jgi:hypothetical protein
LHGIATKTHQSRLCCWPPQQFRADIYSRQLGCRILPGELSCLDPCSTAKVKHGSRRECQILEPLEEFTAHAAAQHVGPGIKRGSSGKRPLQGTAVEKVRKLGQRALLQDLP